jgi:hypothetical protein
MDRYRRYLKMLLVGSLVAILPVTAHAGAKNSSIYEDGVSFGSQLLRLDDGCVSVNGTVKSGTFFEGLKRTNRGGRFEYTKQGKVVTEYPESLTTSIRIVGDKCAAELSNSPSAVFKGDSFSVKLAVEWKDGLQLRPASLSSVTARCVGSTSIPIPAQDYTIPSVTCQLTVNGKGVPLADHLIVSVFGADGTRLTRLSAAP